MQHAILHSCNERSFSIPANMSFMGQIEDDHRFIKNLVDQQEKGVARRVALRIGVAATTINRHYNGTAKTKLGRDTLDKLREAYPNFPGWADRAGPIRSELADFGERPFDEKFGPAKLPQIPLMGTAIGVETFDPEKQIEMTEINPSEVLDHVARPASLARDGAAYALTVVGDSMWPRYRPGRRVIVSPKAPVSIGDDVVVQLRGRAVQVAPTNPDPVSMVLIKELVRRTAGYIELRQFNPDVTFRVDADRVAAIHKVIGEVY